MATALYCYPAWDSVLQRLQKFFFGFSYLALSRFRPADDKRLLVGIEPILWWESADVFTH